MASILDDTGNVEKFKQRFAGDLPALRRDEMNRALCSAHTSAGDPCRSPAMMGQRVCRMHGGSTGQAKRKAKMRLAELVDPAISRLAEEMEEAEKSADRIKAANSILDRAGWGRIQKVETAEAKDMLRDRLAAMRKKSEESENVALGDFQDEPEEPPTFEEMPLAVEDEEGGEEAGFFVDEEDEDDDDD